MHVDLLAIGVHPDDVELCASGTLLKHIDLGFRVGLVDLTRGELGTRGNAGIRTKEAAAAARMLGAQFRDNLDMRDGFFEHNETNMLKLIESIRKSRPRIVLCNAIRDRHPDHGRASILVRDACYYAGLPKISTEYEAWRPLAVYQYIQDYHIEPDFVVDVGPYVERKFELIMAFQSQFFSSATDEGPKTPISTLEFLEFLKARMREFGRPAGVEFAEGFTTTRYIGVKNLFDLH